MRKKLKILSLDLKEQVENEVKLMLAAHRSSMWTQWETSKKIDPLSWRIVVNDGLYGEAFGVMRGLKALGYGYFGSDLSDAVEEGYSKTPEHNLAWWFHQIEDSYLLEEGFFDKNSSPEKSNYLLRKYQKLSNIWTIT